MLLLYSYYVRMREFIFIRVAFGYGSELLPRVAAQQEHTVLVVLPVAHAGSLLCHNSMEITLRNLLLVYADSWAIQWKSLILDTNITFQKIP